ncbi:MAG: ATP-binding cassette domain-containing protein [Firmicutes bacterium]|nr:ATP-binding cassette domain-containing protein [Bacillota bacterium]
MSNIIEVSGLKKRYKDFEAVKGVDLIVKEGEIFGFLGPNGAGKSTTINMLSTIIKPSEGTAKINGYDNVNEKNKVRASIGLIFQESTLDEKLTANENLMLHCKFYGIERKIRDERIQEVLQVVDLTEKRSNIVETFSGGMKRRLEIARGLLHYPKVLFLDEPTVGLDPQTRAHVWEYILKLKEKAGITIFLTTHYMDEAEICDRVAVMDHGKLIALDTPEKLKSKVGGDIVEVSTEDNSAAKTLIKENYQTEVNDIENDHLSFRVNKGSEFLVDFIKQFDIPIKSVNLRRPTLNDVFLHLTGREIRDETVSQKDLMRKNMQRRAH